MNEEYKSLNENQRLNRFFWESALHREYEYIVDTPLKDPIDRNEIRGLFLAAIEALKTEEESIVDLLTEIYSKMENHEDAGEIMELVVSDDETVEFVTLIQNLMAENTETGKDPDLMKATLKMVCLFSEMDTPALPKFFGGNFTLNVLLDVPYHYSSDEEIYTYVLRSLYNIVGHMDKDELGDFRSIIADVLADMFEKLPKSDTAWKWPLSVCRVLQMYDDDISDETFNELWECSMTLLLDGEAPYRSLFCLAFFIDVDPGFVMEVLTREMIAGIIDSNMVSDETSQRTAYCFRVLEMIVGDLKDENLTDEVLEGVLRHSELLIEIVSDTTTDHEIRASFCRLCEAFFKVESCDAVEAFLEGNILPTVCSLIQHPEFCVKNAAQRALIYGVGGFSDEIMQRLAENGFIESFEENLATLDESDMIAASKAFIHMVELAKQGVLDPHMIADTCESVVEVFRESDDFSVDEPWRELLETLA